MFGYGGRILKVNLSTGEIRQDIYSKEFARSFLGGNGFAAKLIHDNVPADVDPLSQENAVVFTVGPLTGTPVWSTSRGHIAGISPLTNLFGDSNYGGRFAVAQKRSGFEAIYITGKAAEPVYLLVNEEGGQIKGAGDLWGMTTGQTNSILGEREGEKAVSAAIGPAGENKVLYAGILLDGVRHGLAARCGMGAVMGAKNLKAVVAVGSKKTEIAHPAELKAFLKDKLESVKSNTDFLTEYGTPILVDMINQRGLLCTHNASKEVFESADKIGAKVFKEEYVTRNIACQGCPVACGKKVKAGKGEFADKEIKMPEYESIYALGPMLDIDDVVSLINANGLCDQYGLDTVSMGVTLAFVAECLERGIVSQDDLGGTVNFGDGPGLVELVRATGKREGIGELLSLGSERLAKKFGPESEKYLYSVKGLEIAGHSARGLRSVGLAYATSTRGGSHQDGRLQYTAPDCDPGFKPQPEFCKMTEHRSAVGDSLVLCRFVHERGLGETGAESLASILNYVTGWDMDADELETIGERIYNLERLINVSRGVSRKNDTLPYRTMNEPIPDGPAKGRYCSQDNLDAMLDEYYGLRGWTKDGIPTEEKLRQLGLI